MSSSASTSALSTTFGSQVNWTTLVHNILEAVSNEIGGDPSYFDIVEYLDAERLKQTFNLPNDSPKKYAPFIHPDDRATIGCNQVIHADASQTPIFKPHERALHMVPRGTYHSDPAGFNCMIPPMSEANEPMTWHDKSQAPAYAYHSGAVSTTLKRVIQYMWDALTTSFEHQLPLSKLKVIQEVMVTKTNVCPHPKAGCIIASVDHLGLYGLIIPIENLGTLAQYTNDNSWLKRFAMQTSSRCVVLEAGWTPGRHRNTGLLTFPKWPSQVSTQTLTFSTQVTGSAVGAVRDDDDQGPAIIDVLNPIRGPVQQPRLTQGNVDALQNDLKDVQPGKMISTDMLREVLQQNALNPIAVLQSLMERQPPEEKPVVVPSPTPIVTETPTNTSSCGASVRTEGLVTITELRTSLKPTRELSPHALWSPEWWSSILPQHYMSLIPFFRKVGSKYDVREFQPLLQDVVEFIDKWEKVPKD
eukprot:4928380-Amphidinium_carterae.5